jgi:hypothetical protein
MIEIYVFALEMAEKLGVDSLDDFGDSTKRFLNPRPGTSVVIENSIENFAGAIIRISFDFTEFLLGESCQLLRQIKRIKIDFCIL